MEYDTRRVLNVRKALTELFRFHYMWQFLGLPWKDIELQAPAQAKSKAKM
jgi:hypothetical protein